MWLRRVNLMPMSAQQTDYVTVFITAPVDQAEAIARPLVDEQLVACVNLVPEIRSIYRWKGEVCVDGESLLVAKTRASLVEPLRARLVELHPYDVPELIAMPIIDGHAPYLDWIGESTREPK